MDDVLKDRCYWAVHAEIAANIKNRQPIGKHVCKSSRTALPNTLRRSSQDELNVKKVKFTDDVRRLYILQLQAAAEDCRTEIWQIVERVSESYLQRLDGNEAMAELRCKRRVKT